MLGWIVAIPLPIIALLTHSMLLVALLTVLLAINQAMTWTTTITSQIDISKGRAGMAAGVNEASGYAGVTAGSLIAGYLLSFNISPYFVMGGIALTSFLLSIFGAKETKATAKRGRPALEPGVILGIGGLLEKFVDAFFWVVVPVYLFLKGTDPVLIGFVVGTYTGVWTLLQPLMGQVSDKWGRKVLILAGFLIMAVGVVLFVLNYFLSAALCGLGMAMIYPTLIAAVNDYSSPDSRGTSLGVYRLFRDSGYGFAGLMGLLLLRGNAFIYSEIASAAQLIGLFILMIWFLTREGKIRRW